MSSTVSTKGAALAAPDLHVERARLIANVLDSQNLERMLYDQFYAEWRAWEAEDPTRTMAAFDRAIGRGGDYTGRIVRHVTAGAGGATPFTDDGRDERRARKALREPEQRQRVLGAMTIKDRAALATEVLADEKVAAHPDVRKAVEDREDRATRERFKANREAAVKRQGPKPLAAYFWRMLNKFTTYTQDVKWIGGELAGLESHQYAHVREVHMRLLDQVQANLDALDALEHGDDDVIEGKVSRRAELMA